MTDEVPLDILWQRSVLLSQLLFMTFTEDALSFVVGCLNILIGMILADGDQSDTIRQVSQYLSQISLYVVVHGG
jgi:hypothetical protein